MFRWAQELQIKIREGDWTETPLPESSHPKTQHGRDSSGKRSHPCLPPASSGDATTVKLQLAGPIHLYLSREKSLAWKWVLLHTRKISFGGGGPTSLFSGTGCWKKLMDHNTYHIKMHHVMIAVETETHPRSSDKNSYMGNGIYHHLSEATGISFHCKYAPCNDASSHRSDSKT